MKFSLELPVRLSHTDAGGVMYFAQYLSMCHQVYEAYLDHCGYSIARIIGDGHFVLPIVHAEADYRAPVHVSDRLRFDLSIELGDSSLRLDFDISKNNESVASAKMVSVCIDEHTRIKMTLPKDFRAALRA